MTGLTPETIELTVTAEHDVARVRQQATQLAGRMGFSRNRSSLLATTVSELANNLVFHTTAGGVVRLIPVYRDGTKGIEVTAEDQGPGIADLALAMTDGYSTNRGLGGGLPGSRRLMDEFHIDSQLGVGTRVVARLWQ